MQTNTKITFAVLGVVALIGMVMVPSGGASNHEEFGTQVQFGDQDFIPTLDLVRAAPLANEICVVMFGDGQNVGEFGFYLPPAAGLMTGGTVDRYSLRLVPVMGHAAGSLVLDSHTSEMGAGCAAASGQGMIKYGDVNNNGRYDAGDYVWLTTAPSTGTDATLLPSSSATAWTIRLTQTSGGAAGSLVFAQDADFTAYGGNAVDTVQAMSRFAFFNQDRSGLPGGHTFTPGDHMYLVMSESGTGVQQTPAAGHLIYVHSIRLTGPGGAFGSQVLLDNPDFIPQLNEYVAAPAGFLHVCVVTFGETTVGSFGFYLNPNGAIAGGTPVGVNFIRLNAIHGNNAGSLVRAADLQEVGQPCVQSTYSLVYADVNNNGRYDEGDWVFMTSNAPGAAGLVASSGSAAWSIRLTETASGAAGSLVLTGDSDFISYGPAANSPFFPDTGAPVYPQPWGVFDRDRSGVLGMPNLVTPGDSVYLGQATALAAGVQVPVYSIRIIGESGAFGSQVTFGDADFRPTLAGFTTPSVCVLLFGDGTNIANSGIYLTIGGATLLTNDVRLASAQGHPAGSVIADADTVERGQGCTNVAAFGDNTNLVQVHYTDRNNNGRYDAGDGLYLVRAAANTAGQDNALVASTGATTWTLRLTDTEGGAAGTLVFAGDSDFITYQNAAPEIIGATVNLFDEDLSLNAGGAAYTRGDTVYISPTVLPATPVTPIHSIRVTGSLPVSAPPPPPPTTDVTTDDVTTDDVTTDDVTTDDTTTTDTTTTDTTTTDDVTTDEDEDADTPGPAILLVLAAIGAVIVALRRRK